MSSARVPIRIFITMTDLEKNEEECLREEFGSEAIKKILENFEFCATCCSVDSLTADSDSYPTKAPHNHRSRSSKSIYPLVCLFDMHWKRGEEEVRRCA
mmetsp:Transcript_1346/g.2647  ORF Transcript_1346/g.2647 Transcript_1346/m.2647 type:complete len:99 (+) Transcript_1346:1275-1571(+)